MSRPFPPRREFNQGPRINGRIRAREVRVIGVEGQQLGVMLLGDAIRAAQQNGVDLVEVASTANPPVCRLVDFGKFRYEQNKRDKESKKHHHGGKLKEIQLSATIDPHDFKTKLQHAVEFLCEDMKVKVALRFRGRQMAHTDFGFKVVKDFIQQTSPWGHADSEPRLQGRSINIMLNPLGKSRRAKNPYEQPGDAGDATDSTDSTDAGDATDATDATDADAPAPQPKPAPAATGQSPSGADAQPAAKEFSNNPFASLS